MSREQSCFAQDEGSDTESEQTVTSSSSSSASSPMPIEDLGPVFNVKGIRATADSSVLTFRISRIDDPEIRDSWWEVTRSYEEFEAFNRLLVDCQKFGGMIYPPLPPPLTSKYEENFAEAPIIHRKQIERYLQMVALHSTLGRSQALADFLSPTYVIAEKTGRKGLFAKLAESFAGSSQPAKVPLRDIEEFFQNERDWSANYSIHLKTTLNAVLTVIHSEKKNHWPTETPVHSSFDECPKFVPAGNEPHPSSTPFQNGRFVSQYTGFDGRRTSERFMRFLLHLGPVPTVLGQRTADAQPTYGITHQLRERQPQLG